MVHDRSYWCIQHDFCWILTAISSRNLPILTCASGRCACSRRLKAVDLELKTCLNHDSSSSWTSLSGSSQSQLSPNNTKSFIVFSTSNPNGNELHKWLGDHDHTCLNDPSIPTRPQTGTSPDVTFCQAPYRKIPRKYVTICTVNTLRYPTTFFICRVSKTLSVECGLSSIEYVLSAHLLSSGDISWLLLKDLETFA